MIEEQPGVEGDGAIPLLPALVLAAMRTRTVRVVGTHFGSAGKSLRLVQPAGRIRRPPPGKDKVRIHDCSDLDLPEQAVARE